MALIYTIPLEKQFLYYTLHKEELGISVRADEILPKSPFGQV